MHKLGLLIDFVITFVITLMVAIIVTLLWNLIAHGSANIEWTTSFRLAIILGIALPIVNRVGKKERKP